MLRFISLFPFLILLFLNCAKEQNPEDAHREEERRNLERLQRANGKYEGYATRDGTQKTPVQLLIQTSKNPNGGTDQPVVQATLRLGLFGGVELVSSKTSYDWKTNELIAIFTKGKDSSENSIELRASIADGKFQNGQLHGARSGAVDLNLTGGPDYQIKTYSENKEFIYKMTFSGSSPQHGVAQLQIKRLDNSARSENVTQVDSDLPYFPALDASFVFKGYEESPETARGVLYDPLRATLQIYLDSGAQIVVSNLYASNLDALSLLEQSPTTLSGSVIVGSSQRSQVSLERMTQDQIKSFSRPTRFIGTYKGSPNGPPLNAIVYLDYKGQQRTNTDDLIFKVFPYLQLRLLQCEGNRQWSDKIYDAYSTSHLDGTMKFSPVSNLDRENVEIAVDENWNVIHGTLLNVTSSGGGTVVPRFEVSKTELRLDSGCAYFN